MKQLWRSPLVKFGVFFLALLVLMAIFGPTFRHPYDTKVALPLLPPSGDHWFGTDDQGRDVFARVCYGARMSLLVGLTVQAIALVLGILVGVLGVYAPAWIRQPLMRFTDGMFAFPDILLAILIVGVVPPMLVQDRIIPVIIALSITAWPGVARIVKNQVASLKDQEFVLASQALGLSTTQVVLRHILPHIAPLLLAVSMVDLAGTILAESALSFLGIGVTAPTPSWGNMINEGRTYLNSNPLLILWPCLILSLAIFALNFMGDAARAAADPDRQRPEGG